MMGPRVRSAAAATSLEAALTALRTGGIVAVPTETVYGLAVLPHAGPLAAVLAAKRRPTDKGIALVVDSVAQVEGLAEMPLAARRLAERFWPGPLTIVLAPRAAGQQGLPDPLLGPTGALGFRLPDHAVPRYLAARLGPLALTSANLSGEPDARTAAEVGATFGPTLALVLDGGPVRGGIPSTVAEVAADGTVTILRAGALEPAEVLGALA